MERKKMTGEDIERRVLASLIHPATAEVAKRIAEREKLDPEMFLDQKLRDYFVTWIQLGGEPFDAYLGMRPVSELATPNEKILTNFVKSIVRAYRQHLRETDRTLAEFTTPGRDVDDEDCLFKNRWLRRGGCGFLISSSGVGKSSFTMQAATQWAEGDTMLGITPIRPLKVGIVQSEDDEYDVALFRDRIRIGLRTEMEWTDEKISDAEGRVVFVAWDGSTGERFISFLQRKQSFHRFDLMIVNPLHAFFGGDLKNADEVSRFLRNGIDPFIRDEETKCAVLFVHHTGKPSKDSISNGDFFAGYMGSGSAELINYPRVALTLVPWKEGKHPGVFELIGSKHGDKLDWRTEDGKRTNKKVVCYANRLERHQEDGSIYWVEPTADELAAILEAARRPSEPKQTQRGVEYIPQDVRCAKVLADYIRKAWTPTMKPKEATDGQRDWCQRITGLDRGWSRQMRGKVYDAMYANPSEHGLQLFQPKESNRRPYLIGATNQEQMEEVAFDNL